MRNFIEDNNKLIKIILFWLTFAIITLLALYLHFYKLGDIPYGIHIDEAGMAYDAFSLANFGVDRYLYKYPVYLLNFGGGQSSLYAYLCAIFIKFFGLSTFTMRLPSAFLGLSTIVFGTLIIKEQFGKKYILLAMFLLTITPYFIMQSRFGLDCNLMLGFSTIAIYFLIIAIKNKKNYMYIISGIFFGLTLYTYALSYIVLPIFLSITILYLLYTKKISLINIVTFAATIGIIAFPLLLMVYINNFDKPIIYTRFFTIPRLPDYRGSELEFSNIWNNIRTLIDCFLFRDWIDYNAFDKYFTLYIISIPFLLLGFVKSIGKVFESIKLKEFSITTIIFIFFISEFIMGILIGGNGPNINKMNGIYFTLLYFTIFGIIYTINKFDKNIYKYGFIVVLISLYGLWFNSFNNYYFNVYPQQLYPQFLFSDHVQPVIDELDKLGNEKEIFIEQSYIYYLVGAKISPYEFNLPVNGEGSYKNLRFYLPKEINENSIYIVRETNYNYRNILESDEYKFNRKEYGMYVIYY